MAVQGSSSAVRAGRAFVELSLKDNAVIRGLKQLQARFAGAGRALAAVGAAGLAAAGGALAPLTFAANEFLSRANAIRMLAEKLGVPAQKISALGEAFELAGVPLQELEGHFENFAERIGQAAENADSEAGRAFKKLGLDATKLFAGDLPDALLETMAAFNRLPTQIGRLSVASALGGDQFQKLNAIINRAPGGMDVYIQRAKDLSLALDAGTLAQAAQALDLLTVAWGGLKGLGRQVVVALLPPVEMLREWGEVLVGHAKRVNEWVRANQQLARTAALVGVGVGAAGVALLVFGGAAAAAGVAVKGLLSVATVGLLALNAVIDPVRLAVAGLAFAFTPLGLAVVAVAAVLGGIGYLAVVHGDEIEASFRRAFGGAEDAVRRFAGRAERVIVGVVTGVASEAVGAADAVAVAFRDGFGRAVVEALAFATRTKQAVRDAAASAVGFAAGFGGGVVRAEADVMTLASRLREAFGGVAGGIGIVFDRVHVALARVGGSADLAVGRMSLGADAIGAELGRVFVGAETDVMTLGGRMRAVFDDVAGRLDALFARVAGRGGPLFRAFAGQVRAGFTAAAAGVETGFGGAFSNVGGAAAGMAAEFRTTFEGVMARLSAGWAGVVGDMTDRWDVFTAALTGRRPAAYLLGLFNGAVGPPAPVEVAADAPSLDQVQAAVAATPLAATVAVSADPAPVKQVAAAAREADDAFRRAARSQKTFADHVAAGLPAEAGMPALDRVRAALADLPLTPEVVVTADTRPAERDLKVLEARAWKSLRDAQELHRQSVPDPGIEERAAAALAMAIAMREGPPPPPPPPPPVPGLFDAFKGPRTADDEARARKAAAGVNADLKRMGDGVGDTLNDAFGQVTKGVAAARTEVEGLSASANAGVSGVRAVAETAAARVVGVVGQARTAVESAADHARVAYLAVATSVGGAFAAVRGWVVQAVAAGRTALLGLAVIVNRVFGAVVGAVSGVIGAIRSRDLPGAMTAAAAAVKLVWGAVVDATGDALGELGAAIGSSIRTVTDALSENAGAIATTVGGVLLLVAAAGILGTALISLTKAAYGVKIAMLSFGGIVAVLKAVWVAVSVLWTLMFAPVAVAVGLVTIAVAGLGYVLVTQTKEGRAMLASFLAGFGEWKAFFGELGDIIGRTFAGVKEALSAGEFGLAADVAMAGLNLAFLKGVQKLTAVWNDFKSFFVDGWHDAVYMTKTLWNDAAGSIGDSMLGVIERSGKANAEYYEQAFRLAARLARLHGLTGEELDDIADLAKAGDLAKIAKEARGELAKDTQKESFRLSNENQAAQLARTAARAADLLAVGADVAAAEQKLADRLDETANAARWNEFSRFELPEGVEEKLKATASNAKASAQTVRGQFGGELAGQSLGTTRDLGMKQLKVAEGQKKLLGEMIDILDDIRNKDGLVYV